MAGTPLQQVADMVAGTPLRQVAGMVAGTTKNSHLVLQAGRKENKLVMVLDLLPSKLVSNGVIPPMY